MEPRTVDLTEEKEITLWRTCEVDYHEDGLLSSTDLQAQLHHNYQFHKEEEDLVEGFQRITSADNRLPSCAVFPTATRTTTTTTILRPYLVRTLQHNSSLLRQASITNS